MIITFNTQDPHFQWTSEDNYTSCPTCSFSFDDYIRTLNRLNIVAIMTTVILE